MNTETQPPNQKGLYDDRFREFELRVLSLVDPLTLEDEINLLRLYMRRVLELAGKVDDLNLAIKVLNTLASTSQRIMHLHRAQVQLNQSRGEEISQALSEALDQLAEELNLGGD